MSQDPISQDLERRAVDLSTLGRRNNVTDVVCSVSAVVASFVAAILGATPNCPPTVIASFAALPGVFTAIQRVTDFRGRSAWYFMKAARLRGLAVSVRFANLPIQESTRRIEEIEVGMEEQWAEMVGGRLQKLHQAEKP